MAGLFFSADKRNFEMKLTVCDTVTLLAFIKIMK